MEAFWSTSTLKQVISLRYDLRLSGPAGILEHFILFYFQMGIIVVKRVSTLKAVSVSKSVNSSLALFVICEKKVKCGRELPELRAKIFFKDIFLICRF